jgi:hypothetical protein
MFDNLREEATSSSLYEEEAKFIPAAGTTSGARPSRFLGMTAPQRFIIAVMMMVAVCALGMMCLLVTEKIALF